MSQIESDRHIAELVLRVRAIARRRAMVAVAGPPGVGKSTFSEKLVQALNERDTGSAALIPMDGFHFDDGLLKAWGLIDRKGSPGTFDVGGFRNLIQRLQSNEEREVAVPVFDRELEISRASARTVSADIRYLIIEGNYLLLNDAVWTQLLPFYDLTVMLKEPREVLETRLIDRWLSFGFNDEVAKARARYNDMRNVDLVLENSVDADIVIGAVKL